jgi:hypothetical protein
LAYGDIILGSLPGVVEGDFCLVEGVVLCIEAMIDGGELNRTYLGVG